MTESYKPDDSQELFFGPAHDRYHKDPSPDLMARMALDLSDTLKEHTKAIATHEGALRGIQSAISAVQSSLGAWLSVVAVVATLLLAGIVFNINRAMAVSDTVHHEVSAQTNRMAALEVRVGGVETGLSGLNDKMSLLPQQVAQELRAQKAASIPSK